jgi:hypothetical protein
LTNLANTSTSAGQNAQYVGAQPLQTQAFNQTAQNVGNYQPLLNSSIGQVGQAADMSAYGAGSGALNTSALMSGAQAGAGSLAQSAGLSGAQAGASALNQSAAMSGAQAGQAGINAAMQTAPSNINQYMNPYTSSVVDEMGRLGQQNIRQSLSPQTTAGIVGAGQFGSQRGAQALGQNIQGALQDLGGRQGTALQTGYTQALGASQADMARQLQAGVAAGQLTATDAARLAQIGQTQGQLTAADAAKLAQIGQTQGQLTAADAARLAQIGQTQGQLTNADITSRLQGAQQYGNLAGQQQSMGLADVNALSTMGAQQQQIAQNQQLFPLQVAAQQAALMKGYTVPTNVSSTYTGPIPGAYSTSPLSQIASLGSGVAGLFTSPAGGGKTIADNLGDWLSKQFSGSGSGILDNTDSGL